MPAPNKATRELSALKIVNPEEFHFRVNSALRDCENVKAAAAKLKVGHATLKRWILGDSGLVAECDLRTPGNPEFGPEYTGKKRGKDRKKRKRRTPAHKKS